MSRLLRECGFTVVELHKFHELSFPHEFYLKSWLRSDFLARLVAPLATAFFRIFRVRNKMVAVGRKDRRRNRPDPRAADE